MKYNRCGRSGLSLPVFSLGLMTVFKSGLQEGTKILSRAFDAGITHFDLAKGYRGQDGFAEEYLGKVLKTELAGHRDELILSSKAGWGNGSRKELVLSLDESLRRMGIDYVDIFYHHGPDPLTPMEETMETLDMLVRQGKALYIGISNYSLPQMEVALKILKSLGSRCLIYQANYNLFCRWMESSGLFELLEREGIGCIVYNPLMSGLLNDKTDILTESQSRLIKAIQDAVQASDPSFQYLKAPDVKGQVLQKIQALSVIAKNRRQSLSQMALAWILQNKNVTSALFGASAITQLEENVLAVENLEFSQSELNDVRKIIS